MTANDAETPPISVVIVGDELMISEYRAVDLIKSLPLRRWDRGRKAWIVPAAMLADVETRLKAWPGGIIVSRIPPPRPPQRPRAASQSWAEHMFTAIPPRLHKRVHRALAGCLHPDQDGDHAAMAALSAARDQVTP